nr:hypothetical protein [Kribbella qitaiheensis]
MLLVAGAFEDHVGDAGAGGDDLDGEQGWAYYVPRLTSLLLEDADSEILGMLNECGADQIRDGSIEHTLDLTKPSRYTAEVVDLWGETVLVIRLVDSDGKASVNDVMQLVAEDGKVRSISWYYFCPNFLTDVAAELGEPVILNGHRYPNGQH